jgi:large subunit ribosomal protein L9
MKILLTRDIDSIGRAGEIKSVADGYARNYLIPKGLAILATKGAIKQSETIRKTEEKRQAQLFAKAQAIAAQLSETTVTFQAKAGESGKLYGSITTADIADAILDKKGIEVDKRKIDLQDPLRMLGTHKVPVKLAANLVAEVTVIVESEDKIEAKVEETSDEASVEEQTTNVETE